jgi:CcmD family protein
VSFLVAAYAVLWVGLFVYLLSLARRVRALSEEARALVDEGPERAGAAEPASGRR